MNRYITVIGKTYKEVQEALSNHTGSSATLAEWYKEHYIDTADFHGMWVKDAEAFTHQRRLIEWTGFHSVAIMVAS